ncbi:MAG: DUF1592 domain-containing protein [Acidimicrobiia bacterium]|nr:DUF1592 domain-containing protein [Acidimicrobiia bacterium]
MAFGPLRQLGVPLAAIALVLGARLSGASVGAPDTPAQAQSARATLDRYCVSCHNQQRKTASLALDTLDVAKTSSATATWEKVVRKLRGGSMPPSGLPRPDRATYDSLIGWLESDLDAAAAARPDPGRTEPFHRLNRTEYRNVIRDLLALDVDVSALLPSDDASYGFDNMAGVLKMSPTLLERYLAAAQRVSRLAVGSPPSMPNVDTFRVPEDLPQDERIDGLPFGTRGGTLVRHTFPVDATYDIRVRLSRLGLSGGATEDIPRFAESHDLDVMLDGVRIKTFTLAGETLPAGVRQDAYQQNRITLDADWNVRLRVTAGPHEVGVAFVKKSSALNETVRLPFLRPYAGAGGDTRYQPYLSRVTVTGPIETGAAVDTPSRRAVFVCRPRRPHDTDPCARRILSSLARRAYRRPTTEEDVAPLMEFFRRGHAAGGFDIGIEQALGRLLISPHFLYRVERDPSRVPPATPYRISELELASRLSFFLWSSLPDEALMAAATANRLHEPAVLEALVKRMLADPKSEALVQNFASQWLYLRNVPTLSPDLDVYPDFDESLRQAFGRETELFVGSIVREDRRVLELLTADYTFVNERLARHYGWPNIKGSHFRRVNVEDPGRRGLLGHGSLLAVTAYPHRTSPVLRGKWILENLLGTPPPPPPPNVPDLKDRNAEGKVLTMRDRMGQHRANPVCASCHAQMDPPGFSLETFDAIGRARRVDEQFVPIDASGVLPDGSKFDGPNGLREALLAQPERVITTFTEKLLTYALGRGLESTDMPAVRRISRESAVSDYRFSTIVLGIVNSVPFQMRRAAE